MSKNDSVEGDNYVLIFRAWRTDPKTGDRIYARDYGLRGFPIRVPKAAS